MTGSIWPGSAESLSAGELRNLENERLRAQLDRVMSLSPFYAEKLGSIDPSRLSVDGLAELPFTLKEEVRGSQDQHPPLGGHACVPFEEVRRVHASSGTTGRPTLVGATAGDVQDWNELISRSCWAQGVRPDWRAFVALSTGWWIAGVSFLEGLEHLGATVLPGGNTDLARSITVLRATGVDYMISTPSFARYIARRMRDDLGLDPRSLGLRSIGLGGEPGAGIPAVREELEAIFGARIHDGMGCADFAANFWSECEHQVGMHFVGQGLIVAELVDPETEAPMEFEEGAVGELVYTAIQRECCPLIRFRIGDLVRVEGNGRCACGRRGPRIRGVGRTDDMLIVSGVNVYPSAVIDVVDRFRPRVTGELQLRVPAEGALTPPVRIRVESVRGFDPTLAAELEEAIRAELIFRADVETVPAGTLAPDGAMKRSLVVREG